VSTKKHLIEVTDAIEARLEYFKELDAATRTLSQPGDKVVLQEDFLGMVHRLDACLEFLKTKVRAPQLRYFPAIVNHLLHSLISAIIVMPKSISFAFSNASRAQ
jgi:hypothetical protein